MAQKSNCLFTERQLRDIEMLITNELKKFNKKYHNQLLLLKSLESNRIVVAELNKIKIPSKNNKLSKVKEDVIIENSKIKKSKPPSIKIIDTPPKKVIECNSKPIHSPTSSQRNSPKKNERNYESKETKYNEYKAISNSKLDHLIKNNNDSYEKISISFKNSIDDILPNPFYDPLDADEINIEKNIKQKKQYKF